MTYHKLSFVSRITLLVLSVEVAAFAALGYFYVEQYGRAELERLHSRFSLVQEMMQKGELPVSTISRQPFVTQLLDTPYLEGMVIGANGRVIVSTEPRQLGRHVTKLDGFEAAWLNLESGSAHIETGEGRHTEILGIRGGSGDVPLYTVVLTVSTEGIQERKDRLILKSLLGSLLFILLSSGGVVFIAQRFSRSEQETRAVKQQLEQVLWSSGDGWWDWNVATGEAYFDQRWLGMLGYTQDEVAADFGGWKALLHPDDVETVQQQLNSHLRGETKDYEVRFRMRCKSGEWKWILARGKVVERDDSGRPLRMTGTHSDITASVEAEHELERVRLYLDSVVNSMPSLLVGLDNSGRVTHWNHQAEVWSGAIEEIVLDTPLGGQIPALQPYMGKIEQALSDNEEMIIRKVSAELPSGKRVWNVMLYPLTGEGATGAVLRVDDITEQVRMETLMVQTEKMMSVGGLAAGMAHEINNPLGGMMQGLQNIRRRLSPEMKKNVEVARELDVDLENVQKYLQERDILTFMDKIAEAGERAGKIVANMLQFSRKSDPSFSTVNINELIESTLGLAAVDYDLKKRYDFRKITVVRQYDNSLPMAPCIPSEIQQVLLNLFRNAAQALYQEREKISQPSITVSTLTKGTMVCIEVTDNGPGIEEEIKGRVFEPFFTTRPVGEGTGLGLSVSYFIVTQEHGGEMSVTSKPGEGTTFTVCLPRQR